MGKWVSYFLPFIGLAIFFYIVRGVGLGQIADAFRQAEPLKLLVFPVFMVVIILLRGFRWQYLLRMIGINYSLWKSSAVWSVGFFAAAVTPGKVGDAIRAYYVTRETGRNFGETFLTVFIDRLMDLVVVMLIGIVTTFLFSFYYIQISSIWLIVLTTIGMFALLYLVMNRAVMKKLIKPIFRALTPKKHQEKLSINFNSFYNSLGLYVKQWRGTLATFLLTVVYWGMVFVLAYYVAVVLNIRISFAYLFIIMPMVTLVELVPISVSGLGTREATVIYFFSVIGLTSAQAVSFSITYLIAGTYLTSILGFVLWLRHPIKLGE
jgi:uncharacterized protein (TIRG00374 family)